MSFQHLIDGMNAAMQRERAESQLTLGGFIAALMDLPPDMLMYGLDCPHSYRGLYDDLAFQATSNGMRRPVAEVLQMAKDCMGKVFYGYKGGDYQMGERTPIWIAQYGREGQKIIGVTAEGNLKTEDEAVDGG